MKSYETSGSTVHTTTEHNDIGCFRRGEALQAKKVEAIKSNKAETSNANRSKTPTKSGCSRYMTGVKNYLHKYREQLGPKGEVNSVYTDYIVFPTREEMIQAEGHVEDKANLFQMAQQPMRSEEELCPTNMRFVPNKSNVRIDPDETQDEPLFKIFLEIDVDIVKAEVLQSPRQST
ncbi:hypothetical protein Tco_1349014 [Tanacetum coccineum]